MKIYIQHDAFMCSECVSYSIPQDGPYEASEIEHDSPQHCSNCGRFLESPLSPEGYDYVEEKINEYIVCGYGEQEVIGQWYDFYGYSITRRC